MWSILSLVILLSLVYKMALRCAVDAVAGAVASGVQLAVAVTKARQKRSLKGDILFNKGYIRPGNVRPVAQGLVK